MTTPIPAYMTRIRTQIRRAEAKADESLLAKLEVLSSILRTRQSEEVPAPHIGQDAIVRLGRAIQSDIASANDVFRSHDALVRAKVRITGSSGHEDTDPFGETGNLGQENAA